MKRKRFQRPKKGFLWPLSILLVFVAAGSLSFAIADREDEMPDADGKALWNYITEEKPYTGWRHWPTFDEMYEGQSPHGAYLKLYVNDVALLAIVNGDKTMPDDAIIVKENYNKDKKLVAVTPMYKVEGYNPGAGNWFWAKYGADGKIMTEGKVGSCIECHKKAKKEDYLFTASMEPK